jgi:copper chaperone CopZ
LHCEGCISKIKKIVKKFKGVSDVNVDVAKDLVTVKGTIDPKALVPYLSDKIKRTVEVVPAKKDDGKKEKEGGGGGDKKESGGDKKDGGNEAKAGGGDGGKKKQDDGAKGGATSTSGGDTATKDVGAGGGSSKVEINKMEHHGYPYPPQPSYWFDGQSYDQKFSMVSVDNSYGQNYSMAPVESQYHYNQYTPQGSYANVHQGYANHNGYAVDYQTPPMYMNHNGYTGDHHSSQMFSDENPNACSVM